MKSSRFEEFPGRVKVSAWTFWVSQLQPVNQPFTGLNCYVFPIISEPPAMSLKFKKKNEPRPLNNNGSTADAGDELILGSSDFIGFHGISWDFMGQWIGLRENLQESPMFNGKIYGFL
jgi:hypothetical protein